MAPGFGAVTTTFAVLAFVADLLALAILMGYILSRRSAISKARWNGFRSRLGPLPLRFSWLIAVVCMLGSLYLSQIAKLTPCDMCWYQRIAMYPMVLLLGIAALRSDMPAARRYALPLAVIGSVLAAYHYNLERFPQEANILACSAITPCNMPVLNLWGFVSVPFMSFAGFVAIIACLAVLKNDAGTQLATADAT